MKWNKCNIVPPVDENSVIIAERGTFGTSVPLLLKNQSGNINFGTAAIRDGSVRGWCLTKIGERPTFQNTDDPVVEWTECPTAMEVVALMMWASNSRVAVRQTSGV